jgi:nicotinamide-nucleotide amidase
MKAEIITIGDELLIGQVVDTNSAWIGREVSEYGIQVVRKTVVGDDEKDIIAAIDVAMSAVPLVLVTGGLGPTRDDMTLRSLCRHFGCELHFSDEVYEDIERMCRERGREVHELTRLQAMVPDGCTVIRNRSGTAPATWFERRGAVVVSMPGVPSEMKWLMEQEVLPRVARHFRRDMNILHRTCWVTGHTESGLALHLAGFEERLPPFIKLAYLPQSGLIRLRLSVYNASAEAAATGLALHWDGLKSLLGDHLLADEDRSVETLLGDRLRACGATVGTAESCTGGAIAAMLTQVAGSSDYFRGSVVAYANEVKRQLLGVSIHDLERHGAVSREVVEQMARGALRVLGCDYAVSTSGVAGPGGGTPEKPVGTVWIAVASPAAVRSKCFRFGSLREHNIQRATQMALLMLLEDCREQGLLFE